ncbi:MAG: LAGLIDADG family homing endonuclease [Nanoarchaeota archaeon]
MNRIFFYDAKSRERLFKKVKMSSSFISWRALAINLKTTRSMLDNYRKGKILLSEDRFNIIISMLGKADQKSIIESIQKRPSNWGQIIGGNIAYKRNKHLFDLGREKAKKLFFDKVKYDFNINMPLSKDLCEFLGVIIGDGCTNKYKNIYQTHISGDKNLDYEYYSNRFSSICQKLFNIKPKIVIRSSGLYINFYSKRMFEILTKRFNMPAGVKCYTVKIPSEIYKAQKDMLRFVLKGMFNTDGGVGLDKRKTYKKPYLRVNYTSTSKELISQISAALTSFFIPHSVHSKDKSQIIQINGEKNVKKFLLEIGFSNPRHLNKVAYLNS